MKLEEITLKQSYAFKGKIINLRVDEVELPNGSTSFREVVEHNGGICVLPIDDDGSIYLVKQWRSPYQKVTLEIPAGKREGDEQPLECGKRELKEEIGAIAKDYEYLGELYPSPGYCGEIIYTFLARGLSFGGQRLDEDEFLNVVKIPFSEALDMVMKNEIKDSKTIAAILKANVLLNKKCI